METPDMPFRPAYVAIATFVILTSPASAEMRLTSPDLTEGGMLGPDR